MHNIENLIVQIEKSKPLNLSQNITSIERKFNQWSTRLLFVSIGLFLILCLFAGYHYIFTLPKIISYIAITTSLITMILSCIAILLGPLGFLLSRFSKEKIPNNFILEIKNDEEFSLQCIKYKFSELEYLNYWLKLKINRINSRLALFFGKDTALLSLLGLIYTINKNLNSVEKFKNIISESSQNFPYLNMFILLLLTFIFGLSLGAMRSKFVISQYQYRIELIELAIKFKKESIEEINRS